MFEFAGVKISFNLGGLIHIHKGGGTEQRRATSAADERPVVPLQVLLIPNEKRVELAKLGDREVWELELERQFGLADVRKVRLTLDVSLGDGTEIYRMTFDAAKNCWMVHRGDSCVPLLEELARYGMALFNASGGFEWLRTRAS